MDNRLNLYSDAKEQTNPVAQLAVLGLSSQPVDHEDNGHRKLVSSDVGQSYSLFFVFFFGFMFAELRSVVLALVMGAAIFSSSCLQPHTVVVAAGHRWWLVGWFICK